MNKILLKKFSLFFILCFIASGGYPKADNTGSSIPTADESKTVEAASSMESDDVITVSTPNDSEQVDNDDIPWGFDKESYHLYKSNALSRFIPSGSEVDQCVIADLDMDGIDDVLLSISIPGSVDPEDIHSYQLNTLILKGIGNGDYRIAEENRNVNYFSSYDCSASITAGTGWFKFTRARGTAGGYELNYLFKYNKEKSDWFYTEYYYNNGGYIEYGISSIQTKDNFGEITFKDFSINENNDVENAKGDPLKSLSVDTEGFVVSVSTCYVTLQDKVKEQKVNKLIADDLRYFIDNLRALKVNVDINLFGEVTFETPEVISIEYNVFGTIGGSELNYSGVNRKYFTTIIDIKNIKRITLKDIIDIGTLIRINKEHGFSDVLIDDTTSALTKYKKLSEIQRFKLLKSSDNLDAVFSKKNTGIFCALHEKSICLYFQTEFFGMGPECEEPKLYIPIENLLPYVKVPYWNTPSEAATHLQWIG